MSPSSISVITQQALFGSAERRGDKVTTGIDFIHSNNIAILLLTTCHDAAGSESEKYTQVYSVIFITVFLAPLKRVNGRIFYCSLKHTHARK